MPTQEDVLAWPARPSKALVKRALEPADIVRYEEDGPRVVLLDQRRLPDEVVELECRSAAELAAAIHDMAIRGAPAIGVAAAYGLALAAVRGEGIDAARARPAPAGRAVDGLGAGGRRYPACCDRGRGRRLADGIRGGRLRRHRGRPDRCE